MKDMHTKAQRGYSGVLISAFKQSTSKEHATIDKDQWDAVSYWTDQMIS
jgi:hypothetical protein